MHPQRAIVAVLAGGRGRRIGGAKATTPLAGRALICHPLAAAREAGLETIVVAKANTPLPELDTRIVREPDLPSHPLCGVLAALDHATESGATAVVLVACDMPFLTAPLLAWLAGLDGAAMTTVGGRAQPLLSRCTPAHAQSLHAALAEQRPLGVALSALAPNILDEDQLSRFGNPERLCFNVNDPADLRRAQEWLA